MRLFVAVNLPSDARQRLTAVLETLRAQSSEVRWVEADSLHITLKFLGEVSEADAPAVRAAVHAAAPGVPAFEMEIGGFGTFPSASRARVFWIAVAAPEALFELQRNVERQLVPLGFPTEKRAFTPHITLGRTRGSSVLDRADVDRIRPHVGYNAKVRIASVDLMRSHLSPRGARYELLEAAKLEDLKT